MLTEIEKKNIYVYYTKTKSGQWSILIWFRKSYSVVKSLILGNSLYPRMIGI